jgi:hypothetical protein
MLILVVIISPGSTVKSVYQGHSREPENVPFIYRLKLYALLLNGENKTAFMASLTV